MRPIILYDYDFLWPGISNDDKLKTETVTENNKPVTKTIWYRTPERTSKINPQTVGDTTMVINPQNVSYVEIGQMIKYLDPNKDAPSLEDSNDIKYYSCDITFYDTKKNQITVCNFHSETEYRVRSRISDIIDCFK